MLATHNSWSYLPPKYIWQQAVRKFSRCQEVNIFNQVEHGAELLDLRVRFNINGEPVVCHGLMDFKISPEELNSMLRKLNEQEPGLYIRLLFETRNPSSDEALLFRDFCAFCKRTYKSIKWFGGHGAHGKSWFTQYYNFSTKAPSVVEKCSSTSETGVKKILPKKFAKAHNKVNIREFNTNTQYLMLDFINIQ